MYESKGGGKKEINREAKDDSHEEDSDKIWQLLVPLGPTNFNVRFSQLIRTQASM